MLILIGLAMALTLAATVTHEIVLQAPELNSRGEFSQIKLNGAQIVGVCLKVGLADEAVLGIIDQYPSGVCRIIAKDDWFADMVYQSRMPLMQSAPYNAFAAN